MTVTDATTVHYRSCPLCEATCGLEITVRGRTGGAHPRRPARRLQPRASSARRGRPSSSSHEDPDRLRRPLIARRRPTHLDEVDLGRGLRRDRARACCRMLDAHGRDAVARLPRQPHGAHPAGILYNRAAGQGARHHATCSRPARSTRCPSRCRRGCMFGDRARASPVPDLDRTDYLLMLGANPYASNGSLVHRARLPRPARGDPGARRHAWSWSTPAAAARPRRPTSTSPSGPAPTPTCWWRWSTCCSPRTWSTLGAARDRTSRARRRARRAVEPFTPEAVRRPLRHRRRRRSAGWPASSPPRRRAAVYGRIGTHTAEFGTLAAWLVDVLNVLHRQPRPARRRDVPAGRAAGGPRPGGGPGRRASRSGAARSRVRGYPEVIGELPGGRAGRGDRDARRRPGAGAHHGRRQPGAVDPRQRPARRARWRRSTSW